MNARQHVGAHDRHPGDADILAALATINRERGH